MSRRRAGILTLFYFVIALYQHEVRWPESVVYPQRPAEASFILPIAQRIVERHNAAEYQFLLLAGRSAVNFSQSEIFVFKPRFVTIRRFARPKNIICDFDEGSSSIVGPSREVAGSGFARIGEFQSRPEFMNYCRSLATIPQIKNRTHLSLFGWVKVWFLDEDEWPVAMERKPTGLRTVPCGIGGLSRGQSSDGAGDYLKERSKNQPERQRRYASLYVYFAVGTLAQLAGWIGLDCLSSRRRWLAYLPIVIWLIGLWGTLYAGAFGISVSGA
jgi:hypothetical protein